MQTPLNMQTLLNKPALSMLLCLLSLAWGQRLAVIGDWGANSPGRVVVAANLREAHTQQRLDALLTVGDNFYPRGAVVPSFVAELPPVKVYPAFGNHDIAALSQQLELWNAQLYYNVRLGSIEVFVLYSEAFTSGQRYWLDQALGASTAPWKVVLLHRPLFSSGFYGNHRSLNQALVPLLERHGVHLVLAGHEHHYERLESNGVTYVITGGGGAALRGIFWVKPQSLVRHSQHHHLLLQASANQLSLQAINLKQELIDERVWRK